MSHADKVVACVEKVLSSKVINGFYSTYIQKQVGGTIKEVEDVLYQLVDKGILQIQYEFICPECCRTLDTKRSLNDFLPMYDCLCGNEIENFEKDELLIRFIRNPQSVSS